MVARPFHATDLTKSPWARANWLVLAPHADDETLGCGALIGDGANRIAAIVFLTDSAGSHPCETDGDRRALSALRRREARSAIRVLRPSAPPPVFLDWPDANPHRAGSPAFTASSRRLAGLCDRLGVDAIAVTGRNEPHCDHVAAFDVAQDAARRALRPTRVFEYVVWAPRPPGRDFIAVRTAPVAIGARKAALAQHRSQLSPVAGNGFRVPATMRQMPARDVLYTQRRP